MNRKKIIGYIIIITSIIIFGSLFGISYMLINYHKLGNDLGTILGFILSSSLIGFSVFVYLLIPVKRKDND